VDELAREVDSGIHPGELSSVTMMGATADHIARASESAGIDVALPRAVRSHYERALAAGHGKDNWTSLIEVMRHRGVAPTRRSGVSGAEISA
jgi:3-hydroxyisobutyrate dehydrogenase-like beta-hydroxyacid dehydrogenase